jgi:polar amino acid transport system substrate-binding protein
MCNLGLHSLRVTAPAARSSPMQCADPSLAAVLRELAPTGRLRVAVNVGNPVLAQKDPHTGRPVGLSVDLAVELGRSLGIPVDLVTFDAAGRVVEAMESSCWDVAFLARDPRREAVLAFTSPYLTIEGTYLVREESPLRAIADFDQNGLRIAVGRGAAYDLFLTRTLKNAELVRADTSQGAVELFVDRGFEAAAGVRQLLADFARSHPGLRVIPGCFTTIQQAIATPRGRDAGIRFLERFVQRITSPCVVRDSGSPEGDGAHRTLIG